MLRLGVVADLHWCPDPDRLVSWHHRLDFGGVPDRLEAALRRFRAEGVGAVVLLGDLTHDGDRPSLDAVLETCRGLWQGPLLAVAGNHDGVAEVPGVSLDLPGAVPVRALGVELDSDRGVLRAGPATVDAPGPLVLLSHYPLLSQEELLTQRGFAYAGRLAGADEILGRLSARSGPTVVLCGHVHARASVACGPVLQLTAGALVEPPYECSVVEIATTESGLEVQRVSHRLREQVESDEPVFAPEREVWRLVGGDWGSRLCDGATPVEVGA